MNRNHYSHSPAALARLRMGWVSSIPSGAGISLDAPQAVPPIGEPH